jgi:hypothetical protein
MPALPPCTPRPSFKPSPSSLATRSLSTFRPEPGPPVSPLPATLTTRRQFTENETALSPFPATLTTCIQAKSFACHSYKKHGGWGLPPWMRRPLFAVFPKRPHQSHSIALTTPLFSYSCALFCNAEDPIPRVFNPFHTLFAKHRGAGCADWHRPSNPAFCIQLSTLNFRPLPPLTSRDSLITEHGSRNTGHGPRITPP